MPAQTHAADAPLAPRPPAADLRCGSAALPANAATLTTVALYPMNEAPGATVMAENNWWGTATPVAGQFAGSIDYTPVHPGTDPNAP